MENDAKVCSHCCKVVCDCNLKSEDIYTGIEAEVNEAEVPIGLKVIDSDVSLSRIFVKNFHGKVIQAEISPSTTVFQLLNQIEAMSAISFSTKVLLKGTKVLILTNKALKHFQNEMIQPVFYYECDIFSAQEYAASILSLNAEDLTLNLAEHRYIFSSIPLENLKAAVISRNVLDYCSVLANCFFSECSFFPLEEISGELISKINTLDNCFIFSKTSLSSDFSTLGTYSVIFALANDFWIENQEIFLESGSIIIIHSSKVPNAWTRIGNISCGTLVYYILVRNINFSEFSSSEFFDELRKLDTALGMQYEKGISLFNEKALKCLKPQEEFNFSYIKAKKDEIFDFFHSYYSQRQTTITLIQRFMEMILLMILQHYIICISPFLSSTDKVYKHHGIQLADVATLTIACLYNENVFNISFCVFNAEHKDKYQFSEYIKRRVFTSSLSKVFINDFKLTLRLLVIKPRILEALNKLDSTSDANPQKELEILESLTPTSVFLMPDIIELAGLTLFGGQIALQCSTYYLQNASIVGRAKIFYTLRHEIAHKKWLIYGSGGRYTLESPEVAGTGTKESGLFLDTAIYGDFPVDRRPCFLDSIGEIIARKIINCEVLTEEEISILFKPRMSSGARKQFRSRYAAFSGEVICPGRSSLLN